MAIQATDRCVLRAALLGGILAIGSGAARAEPSAPPVAPTDSLDGAGGMARAPSRPAPPRTPRWIISGSWRDRQEYWDFFGEGEEDPFTLNGSLLRLGASYTGQRDDVFLELGVPVFLKALRTTSLPQRPGAPSQVAAQEDANRSQQVGIILKQAYWRRRDLGAPGNSLQLGRFEFIDGAETVPLDPSLAWLKRERIAHRLLGTFGLSLVQRSFDGLRLTRDTPDWNITLFGGVPAQGVFTQETIPDVHVGYAAVTYALGGKQFRGDARLFGLFYEDRRSGVIKVDNRPAAVLAKDQDPISIGTVGGHLLGVWDVPGGRADGLLWGAAQFGDWGRQSHRAYAFAVEAGFQPGRVPWQPWIRAGFFRGSGDSNPEDGTHETFFPVLPTPRLYARFPFYNESNLNDAFVQVISRPNGRLTLRADVHFLSLADPRDLWYAGGGAFQNEPRFGYSGRPSGGRTALGTVYDVSVDYRWRQNTTFSAYLGYAVGGDVIRSNFSGGSGLLAYLELAHRW